MKLEPKHYAILAGLLTGLAMQLGTAQHGWAETLTPGFVAGIVMQLGAAFTAIFVGAPGATAELQEAHDSTDRADARTVAVLKAAAVK